MNSFISSVVCSAFNRYGVGTRVLEEAALMLAVRDAMLKATEKEGAFWLELPDNVFFSVSCGEGRVPADTSDCFIVPVWRGEPLECLKRKYAAGVGTLSVLVYTVEKYVNDPDPDLTDIEKRRVRVSGATHVIVGVFATAVGSPPNRMTLRSGREFGVCSPSRLTKNMAGANPAYVGWTVEEQNEAKDICDSRWDTWRTVAD